MECKIITKINFIGVFTNYMCHPMVYTKQPLCKLLSILSDIHLMQIQLTSSSVVALASPAQPETQIPRPNMKEKKQHVSKQLKRGGFLDVGLYK